MVKIKGLYKTYNYKKNDAFEALHNVTIEIEKGSMTAVIGKSGSGKSTLLHIIGCIDTFEKGSYKFMDKEISRMNSRQSSFFRNKNVGIVLQDFALIESYSVVENVMLPLYFSKGKFNKKKLREKAITALKTVGLDKLSEKSVHKLSGGQKQRVAIARAIVNNPSLILADEPTGALDTQTSAEIMDLFHKLNEKGHTVIIVTHDLDIANQCDSIIEISDGIIKACNYVNISKN